LGGARCELGRCDFAGKPIQGDREQLATLNAHEPAVPTREPLGGNRPYGEEDHPAY
jgi:hypothetical protein